MICSLEIMEKVQVSDAFGAGKACSGASAKRLSPASIAGQALQKRHYINHSAGLGAFPGCCGARWV
jgi:hypothetical protein